MDKYGYGLIVASILMSCAASRTALVPERSHGVSPPDDKQVLQLLLQNADIPLRNGRHCTSAQTDPSDGTLGDYFAGVWQHQTNTSAQNWLAVSCVPVVRQERPHWQCDVSTHSTEEEVFWGYGVRFYVDANTHAFDREEFVCVGSG